MIKSILVKIIVNLLLVSFVKALLENLGVNVDEIIAGLMGEADAPVDPESTTVA
ncbi:MAG: hypothetical protein IKL10_10095 [Clostridia bacterium]|nr:hypothetical protein [Clostridia bacterium]